MGLPTSDSFLIILMVLALNTPDLCGVRNAVVTGLASATTAAPYTASSIRSHLDLEQQVRSTDTCVDYTYIPPEATPTAYAARFGRPTCTNPKCGRVGHTIDTCIRPSGKMAGKRLEDVWATQRSPSTTSSMPSTSLSSSLATPSSANSTIVLHDEKSNRAYIVDPITNHAYPVSDDPIIEGAHFSNIHPLVRGAMTPTDFDKYNS